MHDRQSLSHVRWDCKYHFGLNNKTLPHIRQQLFPSDNHIIIYFENYFGLFAPLEFTEIIANLEDKPRKKIVNKYRRLRREMKEVMTNPRPPL